MNERESMNAYEWCVKIKANGLRDERRAGGGEGWRESEPRRIDKQSAARDVMGESAHYSKIALHRLEKGRKRSLLVAAVFVACAAHVECGRRFEVYLVALKNT